MKEMFPKGNKRITIRKGYENFSIGPLVIVPDVPYDDCDYKDFTFTVTRVVHTTMSKLTEEEVNKELKSIFQYPETIFYNDKGVAVWLLLKGLYPDLKKDDEITVIEFS